jgi:UDP-4-amino-4,6-dideoxy-N-acetyl-beta-L-altrosamine transaminase
MIPYARQDISVEDIDAVISVLRSDWLTQGPLVPQFEQAVAAYAGAAFGVASNSATSSLQAACKALGVGPGDRVWTSPNTFVATANAAVQCGATVDFIDIDPETYNLSPDRLAEKLEWARTSNLLPKVVIPVHFAGQPCDMPRIHALGKEYGFRIIEDASHAIGASHIEETNNQTQVSDSEHQIHIHRKVGSCAHSDITVFSFHPVKIITTGEGGMAVTNDPDLAERMVLHRSHGITSKQERMHLRPQDEIWNYQQIDIGFNHRMTDIQAALGLEQLKRIDAFIANRLKVARRYDNAFEQFPIIVPWQSPRSRSSYHLYPIRIRERLCGKTQRHVYKFLNDHDIRVNLHYIPVYRQPFYSKMGFPEGYCPKAELYHRETISLPMFSTLSEQDQDLVINTLTRCFK